ncbi:mediator of RNA polymerase II transcription subunit 15a-like isoform X2 [Fagus crenata]
MKDMYLPEISEMYQKIDAKLQQHDSLPQQSNSDQLEKLKIFKTMLECIISFLQLSKTNISLGYKEKLGSYEKQIVNFVNTNRPKKPVSSLPQGQLPAPHMQSTQMDTASQYPVGGGRSEGGGEPTMGDWQEEVYQKIKAMKDMYLPEISEMYQKIDAKLQQHDSLPQQSNSDQLEKLKIFKTMLERIISFLQLAKTNISLGYKEKLGSYEKQIVNFVNTNRPKKPVSSLPQGQLPAPHMQSMQMDTASQYPVGGGGSEGGGEPTMGDWQEEVYQKIKAMKDMYLPEISEMYQKIDAKLQQLDSLPQQSNSDQLEKLKIFKTMLERIISFLQVAKTNISLGYKEKLGSYEKQIVNFVNTNSPKKPVSSLQHSVGKSAKRESLKSLRFSPLK